MLTPILYYTIFSPPARCVLMTARAIGLKLELRNVKQIPTEQFKKINPQHTVPTLVDDDFIIWDSHAVSTYLIQKYAKDDSLYPNDLIIRSRIDQRLHFDGSVLFPPATDIVLDALQRHITEPKEIYKHKLVTAFQFLEKFLENDNYLVGNSMTVADLSAIPIVTTINVVVPIEGNIFPKLTAYLNRMKQLPYYDEINGKGIEVFRKTLLEIKNNSKL